jgi:hypothetical protein
MLAVGLPPLVDPPEQSSSDVGGIGKKSESGEGTSRGLTFSSSGVSSSSKKKRKAGVDVLGRDGGPSGKALPSKKVKKSNKKLLSFGDDP